MVRGGRANAIDNRGAWLCIIGDDVSAHVFDGTKGRPLAIWQPDHVFHEALGGLVEDRGLSAVVDGRHKVRYASTGQMFRSRFRAWFYALRRPVSSTDHALRARFFLSADGAQRQGRRLRVGREVVADTARENRDPLANRYVWDHPVDEMRGRVVVRASAASYKTAVPRRGGRSLNWPEVPG